MKELLKPIRIGRMWVKNRMVMGPMNTNFTNENGAVAPQMEAYFAERARNGVGLFVVEAASITTDMINHAVQPLITDEKFVPGWSNLVDAMHAYGAKASIEIVHYGSEGAIGPRVSASTVSHSGGKVKALGAYEIRNIQKQFAESALRAKRAGFDAVTLHGAHGYLIAEFLSPLYNRRKDKYGGSLENRARFLVETVAEVRKAVGPAFPIMVRFSVVEFVTGGRGIDESLELAVLLEKAGVDALDISSCIPPTYLFNIRPNNMGDVEGFLVPHSREIKTLVSIPVICAGGMRDPAKMAEIVGSGGADMITLGRALLADEAFCRKVAEGREETIRYCLSCQECLATLNSGRNVRCTVNCRTGREYRLPPVGTRAVKPRSVLVAGAGPAGMAAALAASLRGHTVTLCDEANAVGGTMVPGCLPPGKERMRDLIDWYERELKANNVRVLLNTPFTAALVKSEKPEVVVLATGSSYMRVIPGAGNGCVMTASEALLDPERVGGRVVVVGGGVSGCEAAEYFSGDPVEIEYHGVGDLAGTEILYSVKPRPAAKTREIAIVEMRGELCADMYEDNARLMRIKLKECGVREYLNTRVEKISAGSIALIDGATGEKFSLKADTIILAAGLAPKDIGVDIPAGPAVYRVGDASQPGKIIDAIYSGDSIGREI